VVGYQLPVMVLHQVRWVGSLSHSLLVFASTIHPLYHKISVLYASCNVQRLRLLIWCSSIKHVGTKSSQPQPPPLRKHVPPAPAPAWKSRTGPFHEWDSHRNCTAKAENCQTRVTITQYVVTLSGDHLMYTKNKSHRAHVYPIRATRLPGMSA